MCAIKIGIIGGFGLDNPLILKNRTEKAVTTPFGDPSDVLILGEIEGVSCVFLARHGRKYDILPGAINYRANIWALKEEGCTHVVATNACRSLKEDIPPGTLVIVDGWIDMTRNREQTFHDSEPGHPPGFCHMPSEPEFHCMLRRVILQTACSIGQRVRNGGTIVTIQGPRYSSKAESLVYQHWGAHLTGMTTVPESLLAKKAGLMYAAIAMVTDWDSWRSSGEKLSHNAFLKVFQENVQKVIELLQALIPRMSKENWEQSIDEMRALVKNNVTLIHNEIQM